MWEVPSRWQADLELLLQAAEKKILDGGTLHWQADEPQQQLSISKTSLSSKVPVSEMRY